MKIIATLSVCLFVSGAVLAQTAPAAKKAAMRNPDKTVIYGTLKDARNRPIKGIKAFVYKPDSSIVASGSTDASGNFETNGVMPGNYFVKLVYPTDKTVLIYGLELKRSMQLNYSANPPSEDTLIAIETIIPRIAGKKK